ncbi:MAG: aspartate kinase [Bacteroidales bacterium]|jgi:aspartate kinase|nr:aspartate kinase [Bacteroidales bacterium]
MNVLKFGGTSVGSPENMNVVMNLIADGHKKIVVLSAMSGTTNSLVEIAGYLQKRNKDIALMHINKLEGKYRDVVTSLCKTPESKAKGMAVIEESFGTLRALTSGEFSEREEKIVVAQGELISTGLFTILLLENGHDAKLLPALDFMVIDKDQAADLIAISEKLKSALTATGNATYYITQGFICRNHEGNIDNLQRGGSDYSASLIGAAIRAGEIQIWTDIDGIRNNDPRYVKETRKVERLSFREAAELAYFGAKILHPQTVMPAKVYNIPVRLKNTMNPADSGTLITSETTGAGIKAVAAKDGITAIKIRSYRMLMAYGFMKSLFEIFERFKTPIDMISTSEVAVSLTIDNTRKLNEIVKELKEYGEVEVDSDMSIVCIVGDIQGEERGFAAKVFTALEGIPIRMISYGGSRYNISVLVPTAQKQTTLQALSDHLLNG